ncbi:hypothetical protein Pfo_013831 [Paulownia fortunei]|nr:hypothetical protein Pfo_013831 [Paulownia fortunei]
MAGAWNHHHHRLHLPAEDINAYDYYGRLTPHYLHHPMPVTGENFARFGYYHLGYLIYSFEAPVDFQMFSPYGAPYLQHQQPNGFYYPDVANHSGLFGGADINDQFLPYFGSWIQTAQQDDATLIYDENVSWEDSWIQNLNEEERLILDSLDQDAGLFSTGDLSEETITQHLKTRVPRAAEDEHEICVVCQDSLFQEEDMIATLNCGHEFHGGCIKNWLMHNNCCPLCKATGIPAN